MTLPAYSGGEVYVPAVGRPARSAGIEIPVRRKVDRIATLDGSDKEIPRSSMIQLLLDHHVEAVGARIRQVLAVGREIGVAINVKIVGQPRDLSVYRDRPQVRLLVVQLLSPLRVGDER